MDHVKDPTYVDATSGSTADKEELHVQKVKLSPQIEREHARRGLLQLRDLLEQEITSLSTNAEIRDAYSPITGVKPCRYIWHATKGMETDEERQERLKSKQAEYEKSRAIEIASDPVERGREEVKALVCEGDSLVDAVELAVANHEQRIQVFDRVRGWYLQRLLYGVQGADQEYIRDRAQIRLDEDLCRLERRARAQGVDLIALWKKIRESERLANVRGYRELANLCDGKNRAALVETPRGVFVAIWKERKNFWLYSEGVITLSRYTRKWAFYRLSIGCQLVRDARQAISRHLITKQTRI